MEITEVKVFPIRKEKDRLKAFAAITINNCFVVRDMKIINGNNGLFVAMPSRKKPDGSYADVAHPLNTETRELIEKAILDEYKRVEESGEDVQVNSEDVPL